MPAFAVICVVGFLLGRVYLPLGSLGRLSLETTGGILVAALFFGNLEKLGPLNFKMNPRSLHALQQVSVSFFFAYVGLNYGHQAIGALQGPTALMVGIGLLCTSAAVMAGFLLGRYGFRMNWIILSGALCGSMTSTPGLGAAMESTGSTSTAGAYGSTYPLGLLTKVLIVLLMNR
jgi:putative transport protein